MHQVDSNSPTECTEATTITLEWTVRDLKHLFDTSKGDSKSKVIKSPLFGGGKWQCLFYPNSGTDSGVYVALYLSCEPTVEERANALNGKWSREGLFKFSFELRDVTKKVVFNSRDASNHSFSYKTANWGWAQFAPRDVVYYHSSTIRMSDTFKIICSITSTSALPASTPIVPSQTVPRDLLDIIGNLLDDPLYSDVEFVFPSRSRSGKMKPRTIWATRAILKRADYFQRMFEAGFAETTIRAENATFSSLSSRTGTPNEDTPTLNHDFEDSDEEDRVYIEDGEALDQDYEPLAREETLGFEAEKNEIENTENSQAVSNKPSIDHLESEEKKKTPGPEKIRIVIKDFAYTTYRAVLYYLYTDTIVFAPLSSAFTSGSQSQSTFLSSSYPSAASSQLALNLNSGEQCLGGAAKDQLLDNKEKKPDAAAAQGPVSRKEWLEEWRSSNSNRVSPCSAKAVYRLADKLDLKDLKERAFQHILKSLTSSNVPYEVFSPFSAMFEDVRKVQVEYFLKHWGDIRGSEAMRVIWRQIRLGRHPGFEEVWPMIAVKLEFNARAEEKKD